MHFLNIICQLTQENSERLGGDKISYFVPTHRFYRRLKFIEKYLLYIIYESALATFAAWTRAARKFRRPHMCCCCIMRRSLKMATILFHYILIKPSVMAGHTLEKRLIGAQLQLWRQLSQTNYSPILGFFVYFSPGIAGLPNNDD